MMKNEKIAYINGIILTGEQNMVPIMGHTLFTTGDRILDIRPTEAVPDDFRVIDLNGAFLMPGLINLHVHIPSTGKPRKKQINPKKLVHTLTSNALMRRIGLEMCGKYVLADLYSGVTTLRSVGGVADFDSHLRDDINAGKRIGPRILAANMAVSVPGGHAAGYLAYEARSAEEAVMYVRKIAEDKPDLIKLMITGGVFDATVRGEPGVIRMPADYVKAACDEAHRLGLPVAAHVESTEGVRIALQNGVDTIEHGAKPDDEIISLFKERGAALVNTISPAIPFAFFDRSLIGATEVQQYNGQVVYNGCIECAKTCLDAGVTVGLGTDTGCPYTTHYDMWRELYYFHKYCGVSNSFALHTATEINARILGMEKEIGTLAPGKCADMIATVKNPLEDLTALRDVSMVVSRGKITDISGLKKYPDCERELDKYL